MARMGHTSDRDPPREASHDLLLLLLQDLWWLAHLTAPKHHGASLALFMVIVEDARNRKGTGETPTAFIKCNPSYTHDSPPLHLARVRLPVNGPVMLLLLALHVRVGPVVYFKDDLDCEGDTVLGIAFGGGREVEGLLTVVECGEANHEGDGPLNPVHREPLKSQTRQHGQNEGKRWRAAERHRKNRVNCWVAAGWKGLNEASKLQAIGRRDDGVKCTVKSHQRRQGTTEGRGGEGWKGGKGGEGRRGREGERGEEREGRKGKERTGEGRGRKGWKGKEGEGRGGEGGKGGRGREGGEREGERG